MPTPDQIAATIDTAPGWVKIGLTMPVQRIREDAVAEMARHLHAGLYGAATPDPAQMALPL